MSHRIRTALFAAVTVTALAVAVHPPGAAAAPLGAAPPTAAPPAAVPSAATPLVGAAINGMTEYEAESASTNGSVIGPDYTQGDLATEASGRKAVQLSAGQSVQFSLTASANALDVHYSLSQGASGSLSVYVNGSKLGTGLALTSQYSYISTPGIQGSMTHHFYDDARMLLGQQLNAGDTVKLQVDGGDTAATIDVADLFQVPAAASQPGNSISVVDDGADPSGNGDSANAFRQAINDAAAQGKSVWIPPGTFRVTSSLQANAVTMSGAGSWCSIVRANAFINNPTSSVPGPVNLSNFAILGSTVGRHDDSTQNAINGSLGSGSTVDGLWIQ
ncbi:MAG TPA: glycosyl hydrolase family 28-related protein, partial [Jatrophihabitantaceae bacterium]